MFVEETTGTQSITFMLHLSRCTACLCWTIIALHISSHREQHLWGGDLPCAGELEEQHRENQLHPDGQNPAPVHIQLSLPKRGTNGAQVVHQ